MRRILSLLCLSLFGMAFAAEPEVPKGFHRVKIDEHNFTLPEGFTIEKVCASPVAERPVLGSFDEKGRLYVIDSSGNNGRAPDQAKNPTHRILRLESTKKDGKFDKSSVFADKLPYSQGVLWYKGSLYVGAGSQILKMTEKNGEVQREVWHDGGTLTGCGNDLHGPYLGLDGLFYWTKGAWQKQEYTLKNGTKFSSRAAHVFRAKPDHSEIEVVMTGGMDNPVGLAFLPNGEVFCSCTFLQHPGGGKRDGILHCYYGAVYGKEHAPVLERPRTQEKLTEPMTHLGPAAPAGMIASKGTAFGQEFQGNLFCSQFNMAKVSRHILNEKGATYTTTDSDFVTSDNRDFHPTDVIEDADGSLLIIDTGGWYKMCCPSSITEKKDILGAIYRVRPTRKRGNEVATPKAVGKPSLTAASLHDRRRAAEEFGRNRDAKAIPQLFDAIQDAEDPALRSALIMALIEIGDWNRTNAEKDHISPQRVVAGLIALNQIDTQKMKSAEMIKLSFSPTEEIANAAWDVIAKHPEWSEDLVKALRERMPTQQGFARIGEQSPTKMQRIGDSFERLDRGHLLHRLPDEKIYWNQLPRLADQKPIQELIRDLSLLEKELRLELMAKSKLKSLPDIWKLAVNTALLDESATIANLAFEVLRNNPPKADYANEFFVFIGELPAENRMHWTSQRAIQLVSVSPPDSVSLNLKQFIAVKEALEKSPALALEALRRCKLTPDQLISLTKFLPTLGPLERAKLLDCFAKSTDENVGRVLVKTLDDKQLRPMLRTEQLKPILDKYPTAVQENAKKLYAALDEQLKDQHAKLEAILKETKTGDVRRGQKVFQSAKASCVACHAVGYVGGKIGPDLTRIGAIRSERELLESVVFPSASFVRSYEPVKVDLKDGRTFNGLVKAETATEVTLQVNATDEVRLLRTDIDTLKPGTVSIMPAGLDQQLTKQELADLVAFLKSLK